MPTSIAAGPSWYFERLTPSTNANIMVGLEIGLIRMLANMPSTSPAIVRLKDSRRTPPWRRSGRFWSPSGTLAPSARRSKRRTASYFLRGSLVSTFLRTLPTFLTAFLTADAERPVFLAS